MAEKKNGTPPEAPKETAWDKVERDAIGPEPGKPAPLLPVLQDWVMRLGLRLQGVLVSAIRGCDTVARHDHSKVLARIYRAEILRSSAGDPAKSKSFILWADIPDTVARMKEYLNDCDHMPIHYVMHFVHASEILGYCHPDPERRDMWNSFYLVACNKYHMRPESYEELLNRLGKEEEEFHKAQDTTVTPKLYMENQARIRAVKDAEEKAKRDAEERKRQEQRYGQYGGS